MTTAVQLDQATTDRRQRCLGFYFFMLCWTPVAYGSGWSQSWNLKLKGTAAGCHAAIYQYQKY